MSAQRYRRTNFDDEPFSNSSAELHQAANQELSNGQTTSRISYQAGGNCISKRSFFEKVLIVLIGICAVLIMILAAVAYGRNHETQSVNAEIQSNDGNCKSLDGIWYNQLGSEIIIRHTENGELVGEYKTAVERNNDSKGASLHSSIYGAAPFDRPGSVFGFAVSWNDGESTTAWTGQCLSCSGEEVLFTSWLLRSKVDTCDDVWKSTLIGQDVFTRSDQFTTTITDKENQTHRRTERTSDGQRDEQKCNLDGTWYSSVGSEMILSVDNPAIKGEYRTAVEREKGAAGSTHSSVYGVANASDTNSTLALFVVWKGGESITGWVGQCHVCGQNKSNLLETTWLLRKRVSSCDDNWKSTLYGTSTFTRIPKKKGPRKALGIHTPGQLGEVEDSINTSINTNNISLVLLSINLWFYGVCSYS